MPKGPESILHTLRDCKVVRTVWRDLGIEESNQEFYGLPLQDWLEKNCRASNMFPRPRSLKPVGLSSFKEIRQSFKLGEWKKARVLAM